MADTAAAQVWLEELYARFAVPALSAAVAGPQGILWQGAIGEVDLEHDVAARPDHRFRLASVSKPITATLTAILAQRGLVDLDTPIAYWLPDLPAHHRATTLAQLLTHRGGVRHYLPKDHDQAQPYGSIHTRSTWNREQVLSLFIDDPLVAQPGTSVHYSSFGYSLASIVLEAAAGAPFLQLVADEIAGPFAMPSLAADDRARLLHGRARAYSSAHEREMLQKAFPKANWPDPVEGFAPALPLNPGYIWAGGGLIAAMPDIACFGAAHLPASQSLVTDALREVLFTPRTEADGTHPVMGLGWRVNHDSRGRLRWHHCGGMVGARSSLVVYPELAIAVAFATNVMGMIGDVLGPSADLADLFA
jgi:CubicO group peptidase (beta-lactamase class C family)